MDTPKDIIDLIEKKAIVKQEVYANTQLQFNLLNIDIFFILSVFSCSHRSFFLSGILSSLKGN